MNFLRKLFGKNPEKAPSASPDSGGEPLRLIDKYGREVRISRDEWRRSVLPANLKAAWSDPDRLYDFIVAALRDGFRADVMDAAEHLRTIDPNRTRSACLWAVMLMEAGDLDRAESVVREALVATPADGYLLCNLAKVQDKRAQHAQAEATLWQSLEADPNQENALGWYMAIHKEREGPAAAQAACRRVAALKGSWRAQLWLARDALDAKDLRHAKTLYEICLTQAGRPVPAELLMQMSGDLGLHGHIRELVSMTEPHYDPAVHGIQAGNNLIKGYVELGRPDEARQLLNRLYALKRPDWKETLAYWDNAIAGANLSPAPDQPPQTSLLTIDGPVWLPDPNPAGGAGLDPVFPRKPADEFRVCFFCASAQPANAPSGIQVQLSDAIGRMTRVLPLFFAEQVHFATRARSAALLTWVSEGRGGFVVSAARYEDAWASEHVRQGFPDAHCVVTTNIDASQSDAPWRVDVRILRVRDGACLATLESPVSPGNLHDQIPRLAKRLVASIGEHAGIQRQQPPEAYKIPDSSAFGAYLLSLEQLLAVRCAAMESTHRDFLYGERQILDGAIQLCLQSPTGIPARALLAQLVTYMKRVDPAVPAEFRDVISSLQRDHPLPPPAHEAVQALFDQALAP